MLTVVEGFTKPFPTHPFLCIDVLPLCLVRSCSETLVLIKNTIKTHLFNHPLDPVLYHILTVKPGLDLFPLLMPMWIPFLLCDNAIGNSSLSDAQHWLSMPCLLLAIKDKTLCDSKWRLVPVCSHHLDGEWECLPNLLLNIC